MTSIFVCTKPLQIMICLSIIEANNIKKSNAVIYIVKNFDIDNLDTEKLTELYGLKTKIITKKDDILCNIREMHATNFYIDSDVGLQNFLLLRKIHNKQKNIEISVYEEGLGTYRTDLTKNKFKRIVGRAIGIAYNFGSCRYTKSLYVYNPANIEINKKTREIKTNLQDWIERNKDNLNQIFDKNNLLSKIEMKANTYNKDSILILTDWNKKSIKIDTETSLGNVYIKYHPHIKINEIYDINIENISSNIPAELALIKLSELYEKVFVIHKNSSTRHYTSRKNIVWINVANEG